MPRTIRLALLLLLLPAAVYGQFTFGTIMGTVTDASGGVIPGAKIVITNQGENTSRELVTDAQGNDEALNMKTGVYTVSAEVPGFKAFKATDLQLAARQVLRENASLLAGQISDSVSVSASAAVAEAGHLFRDRACAHARVFEFERLRAREAPALASRGVVLLAGEDRRCRRALPGSGFRNAAKRGVGGLIGEYDQPEDGCGHLKWLAK